MKRPPVITVSVTHKQGSSFIEAVSTDLKDTQWFSYYSTRSDFYSSLLSYLFFILFYFKHKAKI